MGLTADVTDEEEMLTPLWYLILHSHLSGLCVNYYSILYLLFGLWLRFTQCHWKESLCVDQGYLGEWCGPRVFCLFFNTMTWLRYHRVISLENQVGVKSHINKRANTDPRICWRWDQVWLIDWLIIYCFTSRSWVFHLYGDVRDQVCRRSKHPLSTGHTQCEPSSMIMNTELYIRCLSKSVFQVRYNYCYENVHYKRYSCDLQKLPT
jgi:hypothetical protein